MKALILVAALTLATAAQASVTVTEKSFTCQNTSGTIVLTEKKISVFREVSLKHFDTVVRANSNPELTPEVGAILVYADKKDTDVVFIKDLTDRKVLQLDDDKCTDDFYSKVSYKIAADVSLAGLNTKSINMDCIEETLVYEQENP